MRKTGDEIKVIKCLKILVYLHGDFWAFNEIEGGQISGETEPDAILDKLQKLYPDAQVVLTLGGDGAMYSYKDKRYSQPIFPVKAVDTTAAGDTFTWYFLAGIIEGMEIPDILCMSAKASSIAVTRNGAVQSIPYRSEVIDSLKWNEENLRGLSWQIILITKKTKRCLTVILYRHLCFLKAFVRKL